MVVYLQRFLSFDGRVARLQFFRRSIVLGVMAAAIFMTAIPFFARGGALWWVGILIVTAALALRVAGTLSLVVRRLHDLGFSGYHAIWVGAAEFAWAPLTYAPPKVMLASLPLAAICAWVAFWPGSKGLNRFGA